MRGLLRSVIIVCVASFARYGDGDGEGRRDKGERGGDGERRSREKPMLTGE